MTAAPAAVPAAAPGPSQRDMMYRAAAADGPAQHFDLWRPATASYPGVFIHLHGGGWRVGDKSWSEQIPAALAASGVTVVNANYTLTPESPYPRNISDVFALIAYLDDHAEELGLRAPGERLRIAIGGESAGGHLASLAVTKGLAEARLRVVPEAVVSWFAPLDPASRFLTHRFPESPYPGGFWDRGDAPPPEPRDPFVPFIGTADFARVLLSDALDGDPRWHLARLDRAALPPFLLLVGTRDSTEIRTAQRSWYAALRSVAANATLLEIADADHSDPAFAEPAAIGAVLGHLQASARRTHTPDLGSDPELTPTLTLKG